MSPPGQLQSSAYEWPGCSPRRGEKDKRWLEPRELEPLSGRSRQAYRSAHLLQLFPFPLARLKSLVWLTEQPNPRSSLRL